MKKIILTVSVFLLSQAFSTGCCMQSCIDTMMSINYGPITVILNKKFDQSKIKRIAAFPFDDSGYSGFDKGSGGTVSDWFAVELLKTGYYEVIERNQVEKILKEQMLQQTGIVDVDTAVKAGRILGVQGLLMGSADGTTNSFTVVVKLIDVETGNTAWSVVYETNHPKRAVPKLKLELDKYYAEKSGQTVK